MVGAGSNQRAKERFYISIRGNGETKFGIMGLESRVAEDTTAIKNREVKK